MYLILKEKWVGPDIDIADRTSPAPFHPLV